MQTQRYSINSGSSQKRVFFDFKQNCVLNTESTIYFKMQNPLNIQDMRIAGNDPTQPLDIF